MVQSEQLLNWEQNGINDTILQWQWRLILLVKLGMERWSVSMEYY